jgi:predicted dehydrogenase
MIRLGMIGCGSMANYHSDFLKELPNVTITGCCDIVEDRATSLAEKMGCPACTDFRDLLDDVDAVWVCTEPFNRVEIVTTVAAAGKHVFTEKPVALNLADADAMIAACRDAGVKYMLGYCLRFWQPYRIMREIFESGELGDLINCWTRRYMPTDMRSMWYGKQELSGGVALDFGSHDIEWLMSLGGPVKTVFGQTHRIRENSQADEHSQCMLVFENGAMGASDVTWWETTDESSLGIVGTKGSLSVDASGVLTKKMVGAEPVVIDVDSAMNIDMSGNLGKRDDAGTIQKADIDNETIHEHFIRCIEEDFVPATDASIGREVLAVVIALRESAASGKAIDL